MKLADWKYWFRPTWLFAGLIVLAISLTGRPGVTGPLPSATLFAGGGLSLLAAIGLSRSNLGRSSKVLLSCVSLAAAGVLSLVESRAPYLSQLSLVGLAGFVAVFFTFALGPIARNQWKYCSVFIAVQALLSCCLALRQFVHGNGAEALRGNFTNPDCYSVILLVGFFHSAGMALEGKRWLRISFSLAALTFLVGIVLTGSRAAALALLAGYVGVLLTLSGSRSRRWRSTAGKLILIPISVALLLVTTGGELQLGDKLEALAKGGDRANVKSRLDVLRRAPRTWLRSPWLGHGLGTFHLAYQQDRPPLIADEDYMNVAHNDHVQWFVECGLFGGFAWCGLLFFCAQGVWRSYRSPTPLVAAQFGAVLAIAGYCTVNFACPVTADLFWIAASLGLSCSLSRLDTSLALLNSESGRPERSTARPSAVTSRALGVAAIPLALLLFTGGAWSLNFSWNCLSMQRSERSAALQEEALDWESAIAAMQLASLGAPQDSNLALREALLCRRAYLFSGQSKWLLKEESALLKAFAANNRDLRVLLTVARYYEDTHQYEKAREYLDLAFGAAPYSPLVARALARNLVLRGQFREAAAALVSIEKTGGIVDDDTLGRLIGWLECRRLGQGLMYLQSVNEGRIGKLAASAARLAAQSGDYAAASRLLKEGAKLTHGRPELLYQRALILGQSGQTASELKELERLRRDPGLEKDPETSRLVWRRWSEIQMAGKKLDLVANQLADYLLTHQREAWARYKLAEIAGMQHNNSAARFALQEGLAYDEDGQMRLALARMCESQGLKSLAASYYREALRLTSSRAQVEAQLKKVEKDDLELELEDSGE